MPESILDLMNAPRWNVQVSGHYEVWYVTVIDPGTGDAFWIRYTHHAPFQGEPHVGLWFARFSRSHPETTFCAKTTFPISDLRAQVSPFRIEFPDAVLSHEGARGRIDGPQGHADWDIRFEDRGVRFFHLPQYLYALNAVKTKVQSPHLDMRVSGQLHVKGDDYVLDGASGEQSHVWGRKHGVQWCWCHCNHFDGVDGKDAVFEGIAARLALGPFRTPWISVFFAKVGGKEYHFNGLWGAHRRKSSVSFPEWTFVSREGPCLLEGRASAQREGMVEALYEDPDGEELSCYHDALSRLDLKLTLGTEKPIVLRSEAGAALEFGMRPRHCLGPGFPTM